MVKNINNAGSKELAIPLEALKGEMVIVFPKSQVFSYVYAVAIAKNADIYAEGVVGRRLHHIACFNSIDGKLNDILSIIQMLHHTKGVQVFIRGEILDPWVVFDVLSCFNSAKKSKNTISYCTVFIDKSGLPCGPNSQEAAADTLPCRLLVGRAYQRLSNSLGTKSQIVDALAAQEGVYWCPCFINREEFNIQINPPAPYIDGESE